MYEFNIDVEHDTRHLVELVDLIGELDIPVHSIGVGSDVYVCSTRKGQKHYGLTLFVDVTECDDDKETLEALDKLETRAFHLPGYIQLQSRITP